MDKVCNDMGIEMNYKNPDNHVPEADINNRVIKERFRVAYYLLLYKKILIIIIRHLEMNVIRNLNLFLAKSVVSDHYIPHMIMSQRNSDYKNH